MKRLGNILIGFSGMLLFGYCSNSGKISRSTLSTTKGLKDHYKGYFTMGVAVAPRSLHGEDSAVIVNHFNSLTAENAMKMEPIHPKENEYYWKDADSIAAFAKKHGMKLRGHTLCWHAQAPSWMFKNEKGDTVSKAVLLQRLKEHITTVVNRYKNYVYAWDVVNEAIDDNNSNYLRNTAWYRICGEEFIAKAFEYAHAADPKAILFYNDYNTEMPGKRDRIYRLVKSLKDAGVPIHGVGLQGHWSVNNPPKEELEKSIQMFSSLGLQVQVTELDVSVYGGRQGGQLIQGQRDTTATFTPEMEQLQRDKYKMVFDVFRQHKDKITGVTFWNVSDRYSWLDGRGRKNYPLLFDMNRQPKKAYWDVVSFNQ
ncbi:endo-1,4-beta-xylanase [Chitinophagaceae bacterium LB-8]|uniref:Beta-xylanase n=1 Tax=Paraflavisolibacter caeni TaxID=2982496 RepID=A0A9X3BHF3_9BACT|nr:endo-1,4-beta-xylanase [Paraflavisolibacter caeni]MCU7552264.1 endo-1,4-beta-xylanase [Paraflavisolibacter caeni]